MTGVVGVRGASSCVVVLREAAQALQLFAHADVAGALGDGLAVQGELGLEADEVAGQAGGHLFKIKSMLYFF